MRTLLFAICVLGLVGCKELGVRPAGPLAKSLPVTQSGQPLPPAPAPATVASSPPALRPTPPTLSVVPGEVTADNATAVAQKLAAELNTDREATANAPVTVEVSKVGRVKQP